MPTSLLCCLALSFFLGACRGSRDDANPGEVETATYTESSGAARAEDAEADRGVVRIVAIENGRRVEVDGELFTEYLHDGYLEAEPILYPVLGPGGAAMTRNFPMRKGVVGEADDHPHQRSLWFAHGAVNGRDFWAGTASGDTIRHQRYVTVESAELRDRAIHTQNDWVGHDGEVVCTDDRWLVFGADPSDGSRTIDYSVTIHASEGPVKFGDTKEGTMAIRVAPPLRLNGAVAKGTIVNSEGIRDGDAWGKRAAWVAYSGPIDGQTVGIALFDHPSNLRHPCWWHARDYGLLAANPFGAHDFEKAPPGTGDHELPAGESLTFRYRFVFFRGTAEEAGIAKCYESFRGDADPKSPGRDR